MMAGVVLTKVVAILAIALESGNGMLTARMDVTCVTREGWFAAAWETDI
jgi:hypothetical protein